MNFLARAFFLQNLIAKLFSFFPDSVGHNLGKYAALKKAFYLSSLDGVSGDYLEFGVFTGSSMSAAIEFSRSSVVPRKTPVRFFGFDSFEGFGNLNDQEKQHPFYQDAFFKTDYDAVHGRLSGLLSDKSRLHLVKGFFEDSLKKSAAAYGIDKTAVALIDCDTYSGATLVFDFLKSTIQEGTILVIDDFFGYKGSSQLGPYGAFLKFQKELPDWSFRRVFDYGYGGAAYIVCK